MPTPIINAQLTAIENAIRSLPTSGVQEAVADWLEDHPEATTTVLDGSLTEVKFTDAAKLKVLNNYVTPQMYGAKGDGSTDDTEAFQAALDDAISTHQCLVLPIGVYKITEPLTVSGNFAMRGTNNFKDFGTLGQYSTIRCYAQSLFTAESGTRNINFDSVVFYGDQTNALFDLQLDTSNITHCTVWNFHTVFKKNIARIHIHDNSFYSICGYFLYGQITDSYITNNYINGDNGHNAICFMCSSLTSTNIIGNYIDYFKYGFYGPTSGGNYFQDCNISNNIFDIIWRVFNTAMMFVNINGNTFTNISPTWFVNDSTQTSKMYAADAEMLAYRPCAIYASHVKILNQSDGGIYVEDLLTAKNGEITDIVITGNSFRCRTALYLCGFVNNTIIADNVYSYTKLLQVVDNGGDSEHLTNTFEDEGGNIVWVGHNIDSHGTSGSEKCFIDAIHHIDVDNIPRMIQNGKIHAGAKKGVNAFLGSEVIHKGVVYTATEFDGANMVWKDYRGVKDGENTKGYTLTGGLVQFDTNAEKKLSVMTIPIVSENGLTGLNIWKAGINVFDTDRTLGTLSGYAATTVRNFDYTKYYKGLTYSGQYDGSQVNDASVSDGVITENDKGQAYGTAFPFPVKGGCKYHIYAKTNAQATCYIRVNHYGKDGVYISNSGGATFSNGILNANIIAPDNAVTTCLIFCSPANTEVQFSDICVNVYDEEFNGRYFAPEEIENYQVTWTDSVTAGSFDAVTGVLTETSPTSKTVQLSAIPIITKNGINTIWNDVSNNMEVTYLNKIY